MGTAAVLRQKYQKFVHPSYLTRNMALFPLVFFSILRGYDLSFTLGSQILKLSKCGGLIFNVQFRKTVRASSEAVVVLVDRDCPAVCAFRAVTAYIAPQRMRRNLTAGHLFPVVTVEGGRVACRSPQPV